MTRPRNSSHNAVQQHWLDRINDALSRGDIVSAGAAAVEAIAERIEHPTILKLAASRHFDDGRVEEAEKLLRRARALTPRDPHILNSLGVCLNALGRNDAALKAYDSAIRIDPGLAEAHFNRGATLDDLNDLSAARSAYAAAVNIAADYVAPLACLAWLEAKAGNAHAAIECARRALALSPNDALARMALASASLAAGDLSRADATLTALFQDQSLSPVNRAIVLGLMGDLLDAQANQSDAFAAYEAANNVLRSLYSPTFEEPLNERAIAQVRRLAFWFGSADPAPWKDAPGSRPRASNPREHIFLVGFPRSGTTLFDSIISAHPDVASLEEKGALEAACAAFLEDDRGLDRLAALGPAEAGRQREAYWKAVRKCGVEPRGRVFVDKMPLASIHLPVIAKLFPEARVLFALRDPRDVVLSCFRRRFAMNRSMYELLTLEGAGQFYDSVMRLSEIYAALLPVERHQVRYESLVDDFEGTTRAVCDFLRLDWSEDLANFASAASARGITTPSAEQVVRGLNREGLGVWRRYQRQMEPVLPLLEPWVKRFGYDSN